MTQEHIENAIQKALNGNTGIDYSVLQIRGFSTFTIRSLFHALCDTGEPLTYLEVGLFCGATFCASFNKNTTSIGIENHSQDFSAGFDQVKHELKENVENHKVLSKEVKVIYEDCFDMDKSLLPENIDIYFFDGFHSEETQRKALPYFLDKMADKFIWVVDDANWDYVGMGTRMGLSDLAEKIEIEKSWMLGENCHNHPIWHNGVLIYLINKK